MPLSEEEKQRIEEEERVRAAARVKAEADERKKALAAEVADKQKAAAASGKGCLGCLGAVVVVAVLVAVISTLTRDDSPEGVAKRELSEASSIVTVICENAVKSRLKSPGSADFPFGHGTAVTSSGPGAYTLASHVDSQNGFGAMLRTHFVCSVSGSGTEFSGYRLVNLAMQ